MAIVRSLITKELAVEKRINEPSKKPTQKIYIY